MSFQTKHIRLKILDNINNNPLLHKNETKEETKMA
jgi:hypothetical protein